MTIATGRPRPANSQISQYASHKRFQHDQSCYFWPKMTIVVGGSGTAGNITDRPIRPV
jgi:hypothetical protein